MPKQARELKNLRVSMVALVDEPANKRPFLIVKRKRPMLPRKEADVSKGKKATGSGVAKQKVVLEQEQMEGVMNALEALMESANTFAEVVSGKSPSQEGMVIFTEDDLEGWNAVKEAMGSLDSALQGGPEEPAPEEDPAEEPGADEEKDRMAKVEEQITELQEAVTLLIEQMAGGGEVDKGEEDPDDVVGDGHEDLLPADADLM